MTRTARTCIVGIVGLVAGCGGESSDPDPATPDAPPAVITEGRRVFDRDAYPIINPKCGRECHSDTVPTVLAFVATDPTMAYDRLLLFSNVIGGFGSQAGIVTAGISQPRGEPYTAAEVTTLRAWLAVERTERGIPDF